MSSITHPFRRTAAALALGLAFLVGASTATASPAHAPTWVSTKGKTVSLTLIAAYTNVLSGFNFNGAGDGKMTITVPFGDKVNVTFTNKGALPHSAQIVAFSKRLPVSTVPDAFKGAHSPNPTAGAGKGKTQKFSFTVNKAGNFLLICAVPGHAPAGMWDNFVVSRTAKSASVVIKK
jgi:sulfocyanin